MRFSDFLLVSDPGDLDFIVGYTEEQNIRISVSDIFGGYIKGSGNAGYVPVFTSNNSIGNSQIFQDGSNIVIGGVNAMGYRLAVGGTIYAFNGAVIETTALGADALRVISEGENIFIIPNDLGQSITSSRRIIHPNAILATESATLGQLNSAISNLDAEIDILLALKVDKTSVGVANGVASLDAGGKVPLSQIPDSIIGQVQYMGTWNAFTNTPTLNPLVPEEKGHYYVVSAAGVFGGVDYAVGDWIISNGVIWEKVDNTDAVTSVFGRIGAILAIEADYQSFYPRLSQAYDNPTWINSLAFTKITGVPPFLLENQTITLSGDVTGSGKTSISTTISNNVVSNEKLRDSVGTSVIGRSANSTGDPSDIQAGTDGHVLLRSAGNLLFGLISSDSISSIDWSKITGTPTTLSGYGITNAYTKTESDNKFVPYNGATTDVNLNTHNITANSFIKQGGTSAQFLKADGSLDFNQYVPTTRSVNSGAGLTGGGNLSSDVTISFDTTWGDNRYAYRTRQLTINGTTYDLSADRTWSVGTVTSVGISMPSAFTVSNSPVTGSGILTVVGAGTISDYVRGDGSLAVFPSLTGYVPYTGATANVNLGIYSLTASSLIKNGGTSAQFLKADGSVDSSAYIVLGSLSASTPLAYNNLTGAFSIVQSGTVTDGYLSSTDWNTFNSKQGALTLTTTGTSGPSTLIGNTLNIPQYTDQFVGTVTSVGLSMPAAFTVSNSPVTSAGTLTVVGSGTASQYVRGDGSLGDFPGSGGGGGSSVSYYLNSSVSQGTIGGVAYRELSKVPIFGAGTDISVSANGYIASYITDAGDPSLLEIPAGNWNFETYFSSSSGGGSPTFYIELYKVNSGGTATLIASNSGTPELISLGTNINPYFSALAVPQTTLALTDRLAVRYYVNTAGRTITLHTENSHLCQIITTFTTGLTALNGLTPQVQFFSTGTAGTDFNISSSVATHTFNLPTASATDRGALSSADWITFNNKQPAGNYVTTDTDQTISGLKTIVRGGDVLNFKIGTDTLYGLKVAYNQNELVPSGEATWSFVNTFNRNGVGFSVTPLSFFRGVLVTGERLLSASVNANLLDYYGNNPSGRYPVYAYNTGVQQFSDSILVGFNTGVVNAATGAISDLPSGVVANFNGRVIGSNAVNSNEFVTLSQVGSYVPTSRTLTINGVTFDLSADRSWSIASGVTSFNTRTGAITLTSGDVTGALGFTPYNATNPAGYTSNLGTVTSVSGTGTVSGLTLSGTVTSSGSLTLGGTLSLTSANVTSALGYTPVQPNGTGASGTWGINITGNAETVDGFSASQSNVANNIVVRDSSGYIFGSYINMTDDGNPGAGTTITSFITKQSDNYYRSVSPANASNSIRANASGTWPISISGNAATASSTNTLIAYGGSLITQAGSGTVIYNYALTAGQAGLFPSGDNSNSIITLNRHPGDYYSQLGFNASGTMFYRSFNATPINTSQGWQTIITSSNYNSYSPTLTGGGASGTWGISISGSAGSAGSVDFNNLTNKTGGTATYQTSGDFRAPIFYDSNDTYYYLDPSSISRTNVLGSFSLRNNYTVDVDHTYGIYFDSGGSTGYAIYRESGPWSFPFPDLRIAFHTGIKLGANASYNGIRFYTDTDMGTQVMSVNNVSDGVGGGNVYVNNTLVAGDSLRAQIFYDSNNTAFYADFNTTGTSINIAGQINTTKSNGTLLSINSADNIGYNNNSGLGTYIKGTGSTYIYGGGIFLDSGGTQRTIWHSGNAPRASNSNLMYYQGFTLDANTMDTNATGFTYGVNAPYTGPIARFSTNGGYDLWLNAPYGGDGYGLAFRTRNGDTGTFNSWKYPAVYGINVNGGGALYATIYYDQNNTAYYIDPAGDSGVRAGYLNGNLWINPRSESYGEGVTFNMPNQGTWGGLRWYRNGPSGSFAGNWAFGYFGNESNNDIGFHNGTNGWRLDHSFNMTSIGSVRSPIFYDSNNTAFYLDPASTSILNGLTIGGRTALNTAYYPFHSNRDFPSGTLVQTNINYSVSEGDPFILEITGNAYGALIPFDIQVQGYIYANTIINAAGISNGTNISGVRAINFNGNLCFWWPYQSYWQGFNIKVYSAYATYPENRVTSISNSGQPTTSKQYDFAIYQSFHTGNISLFSSYDVTFNRAYSNTDMRAPIFYDSDNTGFFINPNSNSNLASLQVATGIATNSFYATGNGGQITITAAIGSFGGYLRTSGHMVLDQTNTGYGVYVLDGNSVGVVKNAGSQSWSAFSDRTLKTIHSLMEDNLSKLESISPIYYSFNNFADDKNRIGLIAQEVQEHFPELVEVEPMTEKLVLDYTGLIPVLLGAIKELKNKVENLEKQL
jgi:hypothetical protein